MNLVHFHTEHQTVGEGYVADMQESPLTKRMMLLIVDSPSEATDPDAGKWIAASECWEPDESGPQTLSCFL